MKAGTVKDGTVKGGTLKGGTVEDGTVENGTVKAGTVKAGTVKDGTQGSPKSEGILVLVEGALDGGVLPSIPSQFWETPGE